MTNRRPDIHCTGCGGYCYSLSHRPWEQVFPGEHFCDDCKGQKSRGVRSGSFLNRIWQGKSEAALRRLEKSRKLTEAERECIRMFARSTGGLPERALPRGVLTKDDWRAVGKQKLAQYLRATWIPTTRREASLLRAYVKA